MLPLALVEVGRREEWSTMHTRGVYRKVRQQAFMTSDCETSMATGSLAELRAFTTVGSRQLRCTDSRCEVCSGVVFGTLF